MSKSQETNAKKAFRESLHKLYSFSQKPCERFGFTIFTLDTESELHFSPYSFTVFLMLLRYFIGVIDVVIFQTCHDLFASFFPVQTSTEKLVQGAIACLQVYGDVLNSFLLFKSRQKIIQLHRNLTLFLQEVFSLLDETGKKLTLEQFPLVLKRLRCYKCSIFGFYFYSTFGSVVLFSYSIYNSAKSSSELGYAVYIIPLFFVTWTPSLYLWLIQRMWLIVLFNCYRIGALMFNLQLKHLCETSESREKDIIEFDRLLLCFREFESLVAEANETYGISLAWNVLAFFVFITISLFSCIVFLLKYEFDLAFSFGMQLVLSLVILFEFCNAGFAFEKEVKEIKLI